VERGAAPPASLAAAPRVLDLSATRPPLQVLYTNTLSLLPTLLIGVLGAPTAARARRAERGSDGCAVLL